MEKKRLESVDLTQRVAGNNNPAYVSNTETGEQVVNIISVKEVKEIAKKESEDASATAWEKAIKEYVVQNGNTTEIGGKLEVDNVVYANSGVDSDFIESNSAVSEEKVMFAKFNPTGHIDNHWHIVNTKVDDNLIILGGLQVGTLATHDISSIGATATHDDLLNILQAIASSKLIVYSNAVVKPEYYKSYELAETDDVVLTLQSVVFDGEGAVSSLKKLVFTKQEDGSLAVAVTSI